MCAVSLLTSKCHTHCRHAMSMSDPFAEFEDSNDSVSSFDDKVDTDLVSTTRQRPQRHPQSDAAFFDDDGATDTTTTGAAGSLHHSIRTQIDALRSTKATHRRKAAKAMSELLDRPRACHILTASRDRGTGWLDVQQAILAAVDAELTAYAVRAGRGTASGRQVPTTHCVALAQVLLQMARSMSQHAEPSTLATTLAPLAQHVRKQLSMVPHRDVVGHVYADILRDVVLSPQHVRVAFATVKQFWRLFSVLSDLTFRVRTRNLFNRSVTCCLVCCLVCFLVLRLVADVALVAIVQVAVALGARGSLHLEEVLLCVTFGGAVCTIGTRHFSSLLCCTMTRSTPPQMTTRPVPWRRWFLSPRWFTVWPSGSTSTTNNWPSP